MQAHGRLVEDEQGADEARPESGGQGDPLRLAAGERGRRAVEAQVVEAHLLEEGQPPIDLAEHAARHLLLRRREDEPGQEPPSGTDRQLAEVPDREAAQAHLQGLGAQPAPAAGGAGLVAAVPGQEGPHLDAVLAPLEPAEEPQDAGELVVPLEDEPPVAFLEKGPGHVERDAPPAGEPPQLGQDPAVVGLVPGLDRPLPEAAVLVRHHEVEVDLDQVPEAVAGGAGPERVVEREQARLRLEERPAALRALEVLRDPKGRPPRHDDDRPPAALPQGGLQRVGEPAPLRIPQPHPVDEHERPRGRRGVLAVLARLHHALAHQQPAVTPLAQGGPLVLAERPRGSEGHQGARPRGLRQQALGRGRRRLAAHRAAAAVAGGPARAREQQPQVVVDLRGRGHRRSRAAGERALPDGDRRADPVHLVDSRLLHPLEELPGVGGQALDVTPLPFRVQGVEGQAALARSGDPGDHHQAPRRDRHVDPLQVVDAHSPEDDVGGHDNRSIASTPSRADREASVRRCSCSQGRAALAGSPAAASATRRSRSRSATKVAGSRRRSSARGMSSRAFLTCGSQAADRRRASPSPNTCGRPAPRCGGRASSRWLGELCLGVAQLPRVEVGPEVEKHRLVHLEVLREELDLRGPALGAAPGARDLLLTPCRLVAAGEAPERLAPDEVGDELRRRLRLDAVVGGDPVAAVDLAAGVGQLGVAAPDLARLPLGGSVVLLEGGRRVVALDGAARGRVVARGGEGEGVAADVAQRHDGLHQALAERRLAHDQRPVVVLQRAGHDLAGARAVARGQDHEGHARPGALRLGDVVRLVAPRAAPGEDHELALLQEEVRHRERLVEEAPGVVPDVEDEGGRPLALEVAERAARARARRPSPSPGRQAVVSLKSLQPDVAHLRRDHERVGDRVERDLVANHREIERLVVALAHDRHPDRGALGAAQALHRVVDAHARARPRPRCRLITSPARMPRRWAGVSFEGRHHGDVPVDRLHGDPEPVVLPLLALLHRLVVLLLEEVRVGIQRAEHLADGGGNEAVARDLLEVLALHRTHHGGEEAQLVAQAPAAGQRPPSEEPAGQRRADEQSERHRTDARELHRNIITGRTGSRRGSPGGPGVLRTPQNRNARYRRSRIWLLVPMAQDYGIRGRPSGGPSETANPRGS